MKVSKEEKVERKIVYYMELSEEEANALSLMFGTLSFNDRRNKVFNDMALKFYRMGNDPNREQVGGFCRAEWNMPDNVLDGIESNDLKKGDRVQLRNGWYGTVKDNKKGNIRMLEVEGYCTEWGSVYSHDIKYFIPSSDVPTKVTIEHTKKQLDLKSTLSAMGM
jgi:hypothetical protein